MADPKIVFSGSCACGDITFTTTTLPLSVNFCNCVTCRKLSGSPFLPFADFEPSAVHINSPSGQVDATTIQPDHAHFDTFKLSDVAIRGACKRCHSPLTMIYLKPKPHLAITLGSINESSIDTEEKRRSLSTYTHIFGSQRVSWYDITKDSAEIQSRFPGSFSADIDDKLK
ncbi:Mss4-like protein [Elsinoe ampelina]|uniref:Mss4-like protein n=1 Tax=Elsinoe ampelina TaxID=302913 RepID=A0A6A6FYM6_9PEZI|nr:Mss4-like protein [Elsinoe ampelina]